MHNFSLLSADRVTHVKVVVALVCAMMVAGIGLAAWITDPFAQGRVEATVIKPGKPLTAAAGEPRTIR